MMAAVPHVAGIWCVLLLLVAIEQLSHSRAGVGGLAFYIFIGPFPAFLSLYDLSDTAFLLLSIAGVTVYWVLVVDLSAWWGSPPRGPAVPESEAERPRGRIASSVYTLVAVFGIMGSYLYWGLDAGYYVSPRKSIIGNLRQLDGAKEQFAMDNKLTAGAPVTFSNLTQYINFRKVGNETYVLNPIGEYPYAVLESDLRIRRRGFREGYTIPKGEVYRIP